MLCLLPSIFLAKIQSLSTHKKDGSKMLKFIFFEVSPYEMFSMYQMRRIYLASFQYLAKIIVILKA